MKMKLKVKVNKYLRNTLQVRKEVNVVLMHTPNKKQLNLNDIKNIYSNKTKINKNI